MLSTTTARPRFAAPLALLGAAAGALALVAACAEPGAVAPDGTAAARAGATQTTSRAVVSYGPAVDLGNGHARSYVITNQATQTPMEIGVAFDAAAMEGLPAPRPGGMRHQMLPIGDRGARSAHSAHDSHDAHDAHTAEEEHPDMHTHFLDLPAGHGTPLQFVELNWNPAGHEPPGIYDVPHFDFHFYSISRAERDAILPGPDAQRKADNLPEPQYRAPFFSTLVPPGVPTPWVPQMGVHWIDVRSPELQRAIPGGDPSQWAPFTATFIYGSWDGKVTFFEPMVTRAFILERRQAGKQADWQKEISRPARYQTPGYYPSSYRVTWDEGRQEYRVALSGLAMGN